MDNQQVKYIVDEENKVVIAEIDSCWYDAERMLNDKFVVNVTSGMRIEAPWMAKSKFAMNKKYKAVARLHPDDTWDEKRGKDIACDKLTEKYHRSINKRLAMYAHDFRKIADEIDKYLESKKFQKKGIDKV